MLARPVDPELAKLIAATIFHEGYSQSDIARELGVGSSAVSQWCGGELPVPTYRCLQLAKLLDCPAIAADVPPMSEAGLQRRLASIEKSSKRCRATWAAKQKAARCE